MEIDVTAFVAEHSMWDCAHSAAEGGPTAGRDTWEAALEISRTDPACMFVSDATRQELRDHFASFGAWDRDEIEAWDDAELNALLLQFVAGDMREIGAGGETGRTFVGPGERVYTYIGS